VAVASSRRPVALGAGAGFAGDAVAVAVHTLAEARFAEINGSGSCGAGVVAAGPIVAGLRSPLSRKAESEACGGEALAESRHRSGAEQESAGDGGSKRLYGERGEGTLLFGAVMRPEGIGAARKGAWKLMPQG
jgi:hypothetical protein